MNLVENREKKRSQRDLSVLGRGSVLAGAEPEAKCEPEEEGEGEGLSPKARSEGSEAKVRFGSEIRGENVRTE